MGGWSWDDLQRLPLEVYEELLRWLEEQALARGDAEPDIDVDAWLAQRGSTADGPRRDPR